MKPGLRTRGLTLAVCAAVAAGASTAQAYVYWTNAGPGTASGGTTLDRSNLDGSGPGHGLIAGLGTPTGIVVDAGHI